MPELPEVEVITRDLQDSLPGKKIKTVKILNPPMIHGMAPEEFSRRVCGKTILRVCRVGKYILFYFDDGSALEVHLRMTGRFFYREKPVDAEKYTRALFCFEDQTELYYHDIRKFGTFLLEETDLARLRSCRLGIDPLDVSFSPDYFSRLLESKKKRGIKSILLDQEVICGVGNIYADEALHRAGIHPSRKAGQLSTGEVNRLYDAIQNTLQEGISFRGTTFSDYRDLWGKEGAFQKVLRVYRKKGKPCPACGSAIEREVVAGRGSYFCPHCQTF